MLTVSELLSVESLLMLDGELSLLRLLRLLEDEEEEEEDERLLISLSEKLYLLS